MAKRTLQDMVDGFSLFDNWEDRYRYLIDLGGRLPPMDETLKTDENMVRGCTSRVWMVSEIRDGVFHFAADSDAKIVKGLIYLLIVAYQDKPASEIASINIEDTFEKLGLNQHLSPSRRNGFFAMVNKVRADSQVPAEIS